MSKDDFDKYLDKKLKNKDFNKHFQKARIAVSISTKINKLIEEDNFTVEYIAKRLSLSLEQIQKLKEGEFKDFSLEDLNQLKKSIEAFKHNWLIIEPFYFSNQNVFPKPFYFTGWSYGNSKVEIIVSSSAQEEEDWEKEDPRGQYSEISTELTNIPAPTKNLRKWAII